MSYFKFKQFTVYHDKCAMKVGSDGVLLGAWANVNGAKKILDAGCGSGLIALMLAQRSPVAAIHAIDIDADAVLQASGNITISPWKERISAERISLQDFSASSTEKFHLIVSNPPFFNRSLHAPNPSRTQARHTDALPHRDLIAHSKRLLHPEGRIALILPVNEGEQCIAIAKENALFCSRKVSVFPKPLSAPKRLLLEFALTNGVQTSHEELTIESEQRHVYSKEFAGMVKDFYLKL
jgi:tRNA1Val (adenine37-N6)-methyltransferase